MTLYAERPPFLADLFPFPSAQMQHPSRARRAARARTDAKKSADSSVHSEKDIRVYSAANAFFKSLTVSHLALELLVVFRFGVGEESVRPLREGDRPGQVEEDCGED